MGCLCINKAGEITCFFYSSVFACGFWCVVSSFVGGWLWFAFPWRNYKVKRNTNFFKMEISFLEKLKWMQHRDFDLLSSWLVVVYYSCSCASLKEEELQRQACSLSLAKRETYNERAVSKWDVKKSIEQSGYGFSFCARCAVCIRQILSLGSANVKVCNDYPSYAVKNIYFF